MPCFIPTTHTPPSDTPSQPLTHIHPSSLPPPSLLPGDNNKKASISSSFSSVVNRRRGAALDGRWPAAATDRSVLELPARVPVELVEVLAVRQLCMLLLPLLSVTAMLWVDVEAEVLEGCWWCRWRLWLGRWWGVGGSAAVGIGTGSAGTGGGEEGLREEGERQVGGRIQWPLLPLPLGW